MLHMQRSRGYARTVKKSGVPQRKPGMKCCPPEPGVVAETYWLGRLEPAKARQFARHFANCAECARESERARDFIQAIRSALAELSPRMIYKCPPVVFNSTKRSR
jgi:hypothetical protein